MSEDESTHTHKKRKRDDDDEEGPLPVVSGPSLPSSESLPPSDDERPAKKAKKEKKEKKGEGDSRCFKTTIGSFLDAVVCMFTSILIGRIYPLH